MAIGLLLADCLFRFICNWEQKWTCRKNKANWFFFALSLYYLWFCHLTSYILSSWQVQFVQLLIFNWAVNSSAHVHSHKHFISITWLFHIYAVQSKAKHILSFVFFVLLLFIFAFRWNKLTNERQARNISIERTNLMTKHKLIVHQTEYLHFDSVHTASNRKTNHFNIVLRWENENSPHSVFFFVRI